MKKDNEWLYGKDIEVPDIPQDIICRRIELLNDHLTELLDVLWVKRETRRISDIINAINFWTEINNDNNGKR
jgi:hypothetical protein